MPGAPFERPTVLLVEDAEDLAHAFSVFIESEGYAVEVAREGQEALDKLEGGVRPCIIVLDLTMPGMDGFEFRARQRADPRFAGIPVLLHSGLGYAVADIERLGAAACLTKPVDLMDLVAAIRRHSLK